MFFFGRKKLKALIHDKEKLTKSNDELLSLLEQQKSEHAAIQDELAKTKNELEDYKVRHIQMLDEITMLTAKLAHATNARQGITQDTQKGTRKSNSSKSSVKQNKSNNPKLKASRCNDDTLCAVSPLNPMNMMALDALSEPLCRDDNDNISTHKEIDVSNDKHEKHESEPTYNDSNSDSDFSASITPSSPDVGHSGFDSGSSSFGSNSGSSGFDSGSNNFDSSSNTFDSGSSSDW